MKRILIVLVLVFAVSAAMSQLGKGRHERKTEKWLEDQMLTEVGDWVLAPDTFDSKISYKMDERSYEILDPVGMACQKFKDGAGRQADVVIIAGDSMQAFHDQKVCFTGQGMSVEFKNKTLVTKTYGEIPVSWMHITSPRFSGKLEAVYIFRDPLGFNTYDGAKWGFMKAKLKTPFSPIMGYSYRFMGDTPEVSEKDVAELAVAYLDKLAESTNGTL